MLAAIALGSNLPSRFGSPADNLQEALRRLAALGRLTAVSTFHETDPVGYTDQPRFLNAAALLETQLPPLDLLHALLVIEHAMGRDRATAPPKGPRIIDLDLLLYRDETGDTILNTPELTLPHPSLHERRFVLAPLAEIAPDLLHPTLHKSFAELLASLPALSETASEKTTHYRLGVWVFTTLNLLVAGAFIFLLFAVLAALAAFAAGIEGWATDGIVVLFVIGVIASIAALRASRSIRSAAKRRIIAALNALPLAFYMLILAGFLGIQVKTTRRHFILPDGYQGEVYVLHAPHHGASGKRDFLHETYNIPADGILVTPDSEPSWVSDTYIYRKPDGHLRTLNDFPPGTMPDTPQNRANDKTFGVYFPRTGSTETSLGSAGATRPMCSATFDEVWVGTPATLLGHYRSTDIDAYLKTHPDLCTPAK